MTTPTSPALPDVPGTTPAWLIRAVSLLIAVAGPVVVWVDPGGKLTTTDAQVVIILVFLIVAALIFLIHLIVEALHRYGLSRAALVYVEQGAIGEAKQLLPEIKTAYNAAAPVLNQLPGMATLEGRVTNVESRVATAVSDVPAADKAEAESALADLLAGKTLITTDGGTVTVPPKPVPAAPAA